MQGDSSDASGLGGLSTLTGGFEPAATVLQAAKRKEWDRLLQLLSAEPMAAPRLAQEHDGSGWLPLHWAIKVHAPERIIATLLKAYPDAASAKTSIGKLPLHLAVSSKAEIEVVRMLIRAYPQAVKTVEKKAGNGVLPLHMAAKHKASEPVVRALLTEYPVAASMLDKDAKTPLHYAAEFDAPVGVVSALLAEHPEGAEQTDSKGSTPLMHAKAKGAALEVLALLSRVVDRRTLNMYAEFDHYQLGAVSADDFLARGVDALKYAVALAAAAQAEGRRLRAVDTGLADKLSLVSTRLQLAVGAILTMLTTLAQPGNEVGGNARREKTRTSKRFRRSRGGGVSMVSPEQQQLVEAMLSAQHNALVKDAQRFECKVLLAQPLVHAYLVRQWRGNAFQAALEGLEELTAVDGAWLLVQLLALPFVLPLVALYPALSDRFSWMSLDRGVGSPLVRFSLAFIVDVALAVMATLLAAEPGGQLEKNVFFSPCLVVLAGVAWSETNQLMRGGVSAYLSDPFNAIDAAAIGATTAGLALRLAIRPEATDSVADFLYGSRGLLAGALCLLWLRMLKMCVLHSRFGPLVLMVFKMIRDVLYWLVLLFILLLSFSTALYALFAGNDAALGAQPDFYAEPEADCDLDYAFSRLDRTFLLLMQGALNGDAYLDCARASSHPRAAVILLATFQISTSLLLVNMLIAMMAKTFDNVWEAQEVNYMYLFACTVAEWQLQPLVPPPLNLLTLPYDTYMACSRRVRRGSNASPEETAAGLGGNIVEPWGSSLCLKLLRAQHGAESLAEEVANSMEAHEDDIAHEERWRSKLAQKLGDRFRQQEDRMRVFELSVGEGVGALSRRLEHQHMMIKMLLEEQGLDIPDPPALQMHRPSMRHDSGESQHNPLSSQSNLLQSTSGVEASTSLDAKSSSIHHALSAAAAAAAAAAVIARAPERRLSGEEKQHALQRENTSERAEMRAEARIHAKSRGKKDRPGRLFSCDLRAAEEGSVFARSGMAGGGAAAAAAAAATAAVEAEAAAGVGVGGGPSSSVSWQPAYEKLSA